MSLYGPAIPVAILHTPEGSREVHPAMDEWWLNLQPLRLASRQARLTCPGCGGRLVFCVENLPTPYFKHYRGSCLAEAEAEGGPTRDGSPGWFRHHLVTALRRVLPEQTRIACADYLFGRSPSMRVTLPDGQPFDLEVVREALDLEAWGQKVLASEETGVPRFFLFAGHRVPAGLPIAPGAEPQPVTLHGLNADHDAIAAPLRVDIAHGLREGGYGLPTLETRPRSLALFQPGRSQHQTATLALLRGLLPDPAHPGRWHGRLLAAPMTGDGRGPVRFSLRHGFYTEDDLAALQWARRAGHRRLESAWEVEAARREAEHLLVQERLAQARAREAAHRARAAEFRAGAAQARQEAEDRKARLWEVLRQEGLDLLEGVMLDLPYPLLYRLPDEEWQPRLLAFALRAGVPFSIASAAAWLNAKVGLRGWRGDPERENMRAFWGEAAHLGLVRYESDSRIIPRPYPWPLSRTEGEPLLPQATCMLCEQPSNDWVAFDPALGICVCTQCRSR